MGYWKKVEEKIDAQIKEIISYYPKEDLYDLLNYDQKDYIVNMERKSRKEMLPELKPGESDYYGAKLSFRYDDKDYYYINLEDFLLEYIDGNYFVGDTISDVILYDNNGNGQRCSTTSLLELAIALDKSDKYRIRKRMNGYSCCPKESEEIAYRVGDCINYLLPHQNKYDEWVKHFCYVVKVGDDYLDAFDTKTLAMIRIKADQISSYTYPVWHDDMAEHVFS